MCLVVQVRSFFRGEFWLALVLEFMSVRKRENFVLNKAAFTGAAGSTKKKAN